MSQMNRRPVIQELLAERIGSRGNKRQVITEAELYLATGKLVRRLLRRGSRPDAIARILRMSIVEAWLALVFSQSPPAFILRAVFENWSWWKIKPRLSLPAAFSAEGREIGQSSPSHGTNR